MLRRAIVLTAGVAALAAGSAAAAPVCTGSCYVAPAGSGALFLFTGHGWGHGVGLSQYGAYGYAQHGWSYRQILAHYYPGTTLGPRPATTLRVLLADRKKKLAIASETPFSVRDGSGQTVRLEAGALTLGPSLRLDDGRTLTPPLTFLPGRGSPLTLARPYRGRIQVDVVNGRLRAVNVVGLEQYLLAVVPSEMPSTWTPEALKAQAVAARSYALATRKIGAPFDAYSDTRSQMYLGLANESAAATAAVTETKGEVVSYGGTVATTFFSSSSGGKTESSLDWNGKAVPYLVSVDDPYDDISPYHNWGPTPVTALTIEKALKIDGPFTDATPVQNSAGRVGRVEFATPLEPTTVEATTLRSAVGLRSTWFTLGVMSLASAVPGSIVTYGSPTTLVGTVRGVFGVTLEQRVSGGSWESVGPVASGSPKLVQRPTITTDYRIATPAAAAAFVHVRVAPSVKVTALTTTLAAGSEQPALPSAAVAVQQQNADATWSTVATGSVNADGTFSLPVQLVAGSSYRVSVGPATGYAAGTSTPQIVVR